MHRYPSAWTDMSNFVVHFTKGGEEEDDYRNMMGIYGSQVLKPKRAFGIGRKLCPIPKTQYAVCFSEIPPGEWPRLVRQRKTKYGIGFHKDFLIAHGAGPIWYIRNRSPRWSALQAMMKRSTNAAAGIWKLTPLIDAQSKYPKPYFFEWEREWRHVGEFTFQPEDVAFLLIPEDLHKAARGFFEDARRENLGPAYLCPYVDPTWDQRRILKTVREQ